VPIFFFEPVAAFGQNRLFGGGVPMFSSGGGRVPLF